MLQTCTNPECSVQFVMGTPHCPACGAPSLHPQIEHEPLKRVWTIGQMVTSAIGLAIGGFPGGYWYAHARSIQAAIICGLGALIGFCLTLSGVSIGRVLTGVGVMTVSKRKFGRMVADAFHSDGQNPDEPPTDDRGRRG